MARPDEYVMVDDYHSSADAINSLADKNAIFIPHGSLVEYVGKEIEDLRVPIFGNRRVLFWEASREMMFKWMKDAGLRVPGSTTPDRIDRPHIVKFPGAKGGKGYIVVSSPEDYRKKTQAAVREGVISESDLRNALIQEYITGVFRHGDLL